MGMVAVVVGALLVLSVLADLTNTLITTQTSTWRWWLSTNVSRGSFALVRAIAVRMDPESRLRERLLATLAPVSVLVLLLVWAAQQVVGFGLIWWGLGGIDGVDGLGDSMYYSGVVYFTVGFGEVVPSAGITRFGALVEAFTGVVTSALVIGYLPALYGAYSERERQLIALDDGTEQRITPTNLVMAWSPDGNPEPLNEKFAEWEMWVSSLLESHTTFPLLRIFRSQNPRQNWVTALGVLCDAALHAQLIEGCRNRENIWFLRRAIRLFDELTLGADCSDYATVDAEPADSPLFQDLYARMEAHGFNLIPFEAAADEALRIRSRFAPPLEFLIDRWLTPRGFWGHAVGLPMRISEHMQLIDD